MTDAERLCLEAGISMADVCQRAQISEARFKHYIRNGAPYVAQVRISNVFGNKVKNIHTILVIGHKRFSEIQSQLERESGDASPTATGSSVTPARRRQRPDSLLTVIPGTVQGQAQAEAAPRDASR